MKAVVIDEYGEAETLYVDTVPRPAPGPGEVLVRVHAGSLNPADKFLMRGDPWLVRLSYGMRKPRNRVRGQDLSGVVESVGDGVTTFSPGDEVFGEFDGGALAEYACGPADRLALKPTRATFEHAAAIPMAGLAALHGIKAAGVGEGTRLLINGASGGIGTFAIQLAKAAGAHVTAVCSTHNLELVTSLGADVAIDYTKQRVLTTDERYDVILDNVGNHRIRDWLPLLRGRGTMLPNTGERGPDGTVVMRLIKAAWHNLVSRHRVGLFASKPNTADLAHLAGLVETGELTIVIDTMFDLAHTADAMARLATGHARGKVVVSVAGATLDRSAGGGTS
ncbi:MAG: NAD(P)-dependent alcohol dehydrogenase [Actinobacteria bacterium HGW-Actinobacteria-4]|nr:MAG: NAD(P)-dependent alcohol dehydrogenase [Actinobacteria bacterium HGW-Actinobacteria-4]